ncbi:MAG: transketolase [Betaproteobacteria bacterium]|jgi:transketolase|nr:transketolase [Rhodocyclaceae bacterium]MCA3133913.1 transketolase [Rhodocyclaceae bacterium]MCA3142037.1 transketolase [Rhodocyclaceae bacterium]MCA3147191.1 transketolase [Rhodocyclaceae bacterium]MCE2899544.1 transketolase [Betaproteobacteria bacterium]
MSTFSPLANAVRALAMDAVQKANSGHPGMPMGMAEIAKVLWRHHLSHNPVNPAWPNRDRFVLSNGHGSMLLYAVLHLRGYDLPMDELARFRQLHSRTPGHPEVGCAPGVETTTGPLGQGIANAVGMALAERLLAAEFNRPGHAIVDHRTWVFLGDGCLMEGISHEACSLAGTLKLGKLVALYDDNRISIDSEKGSIEQWFTDDTPARFEAYGWRVIRDVDGHDPQAVDAAIRLATAAAERPTLICCKTVIGKGAPRKANTGGAHGAPLGAEEVAATREAIGWPHAPFEIPDDVRAAWDGREAGAARERAWAERFEAYAAAFPELAATFLARMDNALPSGWKEAADAYVAAVAAKGETIATRKASQNALDGFGPHLPALVGGSADLAASNLTWWKGSKAVGAEGGNYLFFGVREFGMAAIMNGLALHGGFIPYGGTFLVFSDYARNALRLAALMRQRVIHVLTHDSIGLGEDGPTHQPVEHAASLRLIPNMSVWRPCDAVETAVAWRSAIERADGPTALLLSRQNLPHQPRDAAQLAAIGRGGYVLAEAEGGAPQVVIIATGSEVALATGARALLAQRGVRARVVSMPSTTVFDTQDAAWKAAVLPPGVPRVAVEAGVRDGWYKYTGLEGAVVGLDRFGESAPGPELFAHFGFSAEQVAEAALGVLR